MPVYPGGWVTLAAQTFTFGFFSIVGAWAGQATGAQGGGEMGVAVGVATGATFALEIARLESPESYCACRCRNA